VLEGVDHNSDGRGLLFVDLVDASTGNVYTLQVSEKLTAEDFSRFLESLSKPQRRDETVLEELQRFLMNSRG